MKFINNFISTRVNPPTLSDIIKKAQTQQAITKTASKKDDEVKDDVEVDVEVKDDVKEKDKKKEEKEASTNKKVLNEKEKGVETTNSGKWNAEEKNINNPNKDPKLSKPKASKPKNEEAESSGQLDPKANPHNNPKVEAASSKFIKVANLTKEQKGFVRDELEKFWPKNFVDALLADQ